MHLSTVNAYQGWPDEPLTACPGWPVVLNPQIIVVGGELAAVGERLFEPMRRTVARRDVVGLTLVPEPSL